MLEAIFRIKLWQRRVFAILVAFLLGAVLGGIQAPVWVLFLLLALVVIILVPLCVVEDVGSN